MKRLVHLHRRAGPLFRLASEYTVAQMAARSLAAISGLILVRLLPLSEYGFYTLLLSVFTFICTFSDLGATESLSFFRRRASIKNKPWSHYFHAVMRFRSSVFLIGFIVGAVYILYTAQPIGQGSLSIFAGVLLMGLAAWFSIQFNIISYILKLEQKFRKAYLLDIGNESVKLVVIFLIWILGGATALAGILSIAAGALGTALLAGKISQITISESLPPSPSRIRRSTLVLLKQVLPTFPGSLHFALQGVLVAWLAVYYGPIGNLAEVGALGRIGVIISIIAGFTSTVFIPRLIAITDEFIFLKRYLMWGAVIGFAGTAIIFAVWIFPSGLLFLLGQSYSGLHTELLVTAATAVIGTWGAFAFNINRARGWVKYQFYSVPFIVAGQFFLFFLLDFSETIGVLLFSLGTFLIGFIYQLLLNFFGFLENTKHRSVAE